MDCFYINLDTANERRQRFEDNFNARKRPHWTLTRFPAVNADFVAKHGIKGETSPAEKGCFLSHKTIIRDNLGHDRTIFIFEDDAVLGARTCELIDGILGGGEDSSWDILYTDICIPQVPAMIDTLRIRRELAAKKAEVTFLKLTKTNFAGSTAYLINGKSKRKVYELLDMADELNIPYDLYLRALVHISIIKGFALFPFVTSLSEFSEASQIKLTNVNQSQVLWNMYRKMIWMERNLADCTSELDVLKSTLTKTDMAEFNSLLTSPDRELRAFGILFSKAAANAA